MNDNTFLPKLSQNLLEILEDNEFYDVTIEVGNDPYVKIFRAHIVVLYYRSPYLRRILSTNKKQNDEILVHIKLPNISPEIFQIILRYIYGGKLSLKEYDTSDIIKIMVAAIELNLQELITHLQSFLIENKKDWIEQNFNLIYQTSYGNNSFSRLQNFCTELMSKEPEKIFNSIDFISLSENCLISLIQHDNFQMDVIKVWEHILKWGIARNPELTSDPSSYSKDDFNILKNILEQIIPFIKFYNLTSGEFLDKVYPYKKIIPKELRENLVKYFLNPNNQSVKKFNNPKSIDSRIITIQHAELISKWIDRLEITDKIKNSYEFKLILRGSRDGFSPSKFHETCDNRSHTILIIKVKDSNEILGGYNPIMWTSDITWGATKDSFIFSFKNKNDIENYILSRVKVEKCAIINGYNCGPSFAAGLIIGIMNGDDIHNNNIHNRGYCRKNIIYEKPIRETVDDFALEECEIFQITKC
ncbi:uncharacterized protein OCT59_001222 [Rhizophagus irregularis]|uniref:Serine-enriched protein n=2 Tax=Rhizophagus irregularis TaxID=588596 RepID=A0A015K5H5_RHIIW|nr:hypothetical protein RirG_232650 [Rhizophagus irregularis DAOM 197198w]UZN99965.1 hypothetical protein OCT59_001222 [Rhizophagus irregularis]GBC28940.1 carbohydrate-binding module family 13 protein [Rhizophagus irregularis DAOM 181602=DAOM 197198]